MKHQGTTLEKRNTITDARNGEVVQKTTHGYEPSDDERALARLERFTVIGHWIIGAVTSLLAARFLLNLLGANPEAAFTRMVTILTQPLVAPFTAIFGSPVVGQAMLDSAALVALVVYPVVGYGLLQLLRAILAPSDPRGHAYTT